MKLIDFMKLNIPGVEGRADFQSFLSLKECLLHDDYEIGREASSYFYDYLALKSRLFDEAMGNFITKRKGLINEQ